jgi:hypothetical protein
MIVMRRFDRKVRCGYVEYKDSKWKLTVHVADKLAPTVLLSAKTAVCSRFSVTLTSSQLVLFPQPSICCVLEIAPCYAPHTHRSKVMFVVAVIVRTILVLIFLLFLIIPSLFILLFCHF